MHRYSALEIHPSNVEESERAQLCEQAERTNERAGAHEHWRECSMSANDRSPVGCVEASSRPEIVRTSQGESGPGRDRTARKRAHERRADKEKKNGSRVWCARVCALALARRTKLGSPRPKRVGRALAAPQGRRRRPAHSVQPLLAWMSCARARLQLVRRRGRFCCTADASLAVMSKGIQPTMQPRVAPAQAPRCLASSAGRRRVCPSVRLVRASPCPLALGRTDVAWLAHRRAGGRRCQCRSGYKFCLTGMERGACVARASERPRARPSGADPPRRGVHWPSPAICGLGPSGQVGGGHCQTWPSWRPERMRARTLERANEQPENSDAARRRARQLGRTNWANKRTNGREFMCGRCCAGRPSCTSAPAGERIVRSSVDLRGQRSLRSSCASKIGTAPACCVCALCRRVHAVPTRARSCAAQSAQRCASLLA